MGSSTTSSARDPHVSLQRSCWLIPTLRAPETSTEVTMAPTTPTWKKDAGGLQDLLRRPFDFVLFLYFVIHIPITIVFDSQGVLPGHLYPAGLRGMVADYLRGTCDPIMGGSTGAIPVWAWSFISCEILLQFPSFFFFAYALWSKKKSIRIPGIIYGVHVATTLVGILAHLIYMPFLVLPLAFAVKCALLE